MGQSLHQVYAHIVFSTKNRQALIKPSIESKLYAYICGIIQQFEGHVVAINGMPDHIHILLRLSNKFADMDLIKNIKGSSSKWMVEAGYSGFAWQSGYGMFSVSFKTLGAAKEYIDTQKEHHKTLSFKDELRRILNAYDIEYNEKYLWS